jgi:hypothetical protein
MPLSWNEIKARAIAFAKEWADAGDERAQARPFWIDFFAVFGLTPKRLASFEHAVKKHGGGQGYVDLFWPGMLLVEHKSRGKSLERAFDQALDYFPGIAERDLPRYVLVSDFARLRLTELGSGEQVEFALIDLHKHLRRFAFIAGYQVQTIKPQDPVNLRAAERMGRLHDALKASGYGGHALEVLLVRVLFCLFADDTGIFQPAQAFRAWVEERTAVDGSDLGPQLAALFQVLNTPEDKRSRALDEQLAAFPYVNGALFAEALPLAAFDAAMRDSLLDACAIDWTAISPAIFGALFQSIMDAKARRNLCAHYTSEENILKLIQPLFLDELWAEFHKVKGNRNRLFEFHKKLRALNLLDPACGCGNFLVISYRELRLLELEVLRAAYAGGQRTLDVHQLIALDVDQFHGIEIEEFPAQIAQVALWLIDHQMNLRVSEEFGQYFARIPLKATPHIVHGNALRLDWAEVLPPDRCAYVLGNPPFVGKKEQSAQQKADFEPVMHHLPGSGVLDFVAAWYVLATRYLLAAEGSKPRCAFVSTNSITQGEQVGVLWSWLLAQGAKIHFAHRTFQWSNEARGVAAVHCVIVGFGIGDLDAQKVLFEYGDIRGEAHPVPVHNINPYLVDGPDLLLAARREPIGDVPSVGYGSFALDDGNYTLSAGERESVLAEDANAAQFLRPFIGGVELIHGIERWCLWLANANPAQIRQCKTVLRRVEAVQKWRGGRGRETTRQLAATPARFAENRQPASDYIAIPTVSSERRTFIPMGFLGPEVIASNQLYVVPGATRYHFGVLTSTMHNAWVRYTCGRLKSDFRYSAAIVYNNFPWPEAPTDAQRAAVEAAAQSVLDARSQFPGATLADLYDPLTMPPALLKAHHKLDAAVDAAYGKKPGAFKTDAERVAFLFERYQALTSLLPVPAAKKARSVKRGPT